MIACGVHRIYQSVFLIPSVIRFHGACVNVVTFLFSYKRNSGLLCTDFHETPTLNSLIQILIQIGRRFEGDIWKLWILFYARP